jgi:hypothetical protein
VQEGKRYIYSRTRDAAQQPANRAQRATAGAWLVVRAQKECATCKKRKLIMQGSELVAKSDSAFCAYTQFKPACGLQLLAYTLLESA